MIRVEPIPQPAGWSEQVEQRGMDWLSSHPEATRPTDLWRGFRSELAAGFQWRCGYTAMWEPNGVVDHFIPWGTAAGPEERALAYEWTNLRYSVGWFNSARQTTPIPDPFRIEDDWFELLLPSLELVSTDRVPPQEAARVGAALRWLGADARVLRTRQGWWDLYHTGELSLAGLDRRAPLIARALRKNPEFMRPADREALLGP